MVRMKKDKWNGKILMPFVNVHKCMTQQLVKQWKEGKNSEITGDCFLVKLKAILVSMLHCGENLVTFSFNSSPTRRILLTVTRKSNFQ